MILIYFDIIADNVIKANITECNSGGKIWVKLV